MKIEVISIGSSLLLNERIDTNAAYIVRQLSAAGANLSCRIIVGNEQPILTDVIGQALQRADIVITIGGLSAEGQSLVDTAVSNIQDWPHSQPVPTAKGNFEHPNFGRKWRVDQKTIFCLPGERRDMAFLMETLVLPFIREHFDTGMIIGTKLLRTVGATESSLRQQLEAVKLSPGQEITFDSFAGQTNIFLTTRGRDQITVDNNLRQLTQEITSRLGRHIFGEDQDRLEQIILSALQKNEIKVALAECHTQQILGRTLQLLPAAAIAFELANSTSRTELNIELDLQPDPTEQITHWCRRAAERLRQRNGTDLGLLVYNWAAPGGVQILVTLSSSKGVSITQRSFSGHPANIYDWAFSLGLAHLRRWLLVYY